MSATKPRVAVFKMASCDGCQLQLLDAEEALLELAGAIEIANFAEASSNMLEGPYDVTLVEGSVSTPEQIGQLKKIRADTTFLITIGACATSGGIQALRNWKDVKEYTRLVYASPEYISTLDRSMPVGSYVHVDFELRGCPINKMQLLEVLNAYLNKRKPTVPSHSVCVECKLRGTTCVMVAHETPCMGPVTHAGCGAICPTYARGCYGCFGPMENANPPSLSVRFGRLGMSNHEIMLAFRGFNAYSEAFRKESDVHEK
jgi:sulfhydrogenase subunit delta